MADGIGENRVRPVLVVTRPFGAFRTGDVVQDADEMRAMLGGPHAHDLVRVAAALPARNDEEG